MTRWAVAFVGAFMLGVTACGFVDSFQNTVVQRTGVNVWTVAFKVGPTGLVASDQKITAFKGVDCKRTNTYLGLDYVIVCRAPGTVELVTTGTPLARVVGTAFEDFKP